MDLKLIEKTDKEVADSMLRELRRQQGNIELIASENFVSRAVMEAVGSHLTNKYAEGYPGTHTTYGKLGVKVWIYTGEVLAEKKARKEGGNK